MRSEQPVIIREMKTGEEALLVRAARRAFMHSPFEQVAIAKPRDALVAEVDGQVAGAIFLREFGEGDRKIGYLDVGFVTKAYRGRGIGRVLYPAAVNRLRDRGCDLVAGMVIDDNTASWKSLANQGFGTPSLTELIRRAGPGRALSLWLRTLLCLAGGTRLWMSGPVRKRRSPEELLSFLWVNLLLFLPWLLRFTGRPALLAEILPAFPTVLLAGVLFGGLGCLAAGRRWRFSFPRGGMLISLVLNAMGSVFPMVGRWYLESPRASKECWRALGVQAAVEWAGLLGLFALGAYALPDTGFMYHSAALTANLLIYRLLPFMPFGSFGGFRVWAWSKPAFALLRLVSAGLIAAASR